MHNKTGKVVHPLILVVHAGAGRRTTLAEYEVAGGLAAELHVEEMRDESHIK